MNGILIPNRKYLLLFMYLIIMYYYFIRRTANRYITMQLKECGRPHDLPIYAYIIFNKKKIIMFGITIHLYLVVL